MPSFRVTMTIGALRPGVDPVAVLPAAKAAALELAVVEAADVQVVSGRARIVIRFTPEAADTAPQIAAHVASVAHTFAAVERWILTERVGGRWEPVPTWPAPA